MDQNDDRDRLAKLVLKHRVMRSDGAYERHYPELTSAFIRDIERRVSRLRNATIRPKKKRKR